MTEPTVVAMLLGALQGATEFLPVSSSGHLAVAERLLGVEDGGLTLSVMLHAGTLLAVGVVLRRRLLDALRQGVLALRQPSRWRGTAGGRDACFVLVASVPTAIIGLSLHDLVDEWTHSPLAVGLGFVVTTALLVSVRGARTGTLEVPSHLGAILIGLAQGIAVAPGISRSGATICVALWLGVRPDRAFELSMLASVPAVLGAVIFEGSGWFAEGAELGSALGGAAVALFVGVVALLVLRGVVDRGRIGWFAVWTAPLAAICFFLAVRS